MSPRLAVAVLVLAGCKREPATRASAAAPLVDAGAAPVVVACGETDPAVPDADGLAFLHHVAGTLRVELTEPPARITAVVFKPYRLVNDERVPLAAGDLDRVIFRGSVLRLRSFGKVVAHTERDCAYTLRDLVRAIEATELRTRGDNRWIDGIDLHHVDFQGLSPAADGSWRIGWVG